jgi:hypothetical protein
MRPMIAFGFAMILAAFAALAQTAPPSKAVIPEPAADAAKQALGVIVSVDAVASTVTLASGDTFQLPMDVKTTDLKIGTRVRIEFETDAKGIKVAKAIAAIVEGPDAPPPVTSPGGPPAAGAG